MSETTSSDPTRRFTLWACQRLALEIVGDPNECFSIKLPETARAEFDGQERPRFTFDRELYKQSGNNDLELVAPGGRLLSWLVSRVRELGNVAHAAPADQPGSVAEISGQLFSAYKVDSGSARLAGCTLDDRPFLRLTFRLRLESLEPRDELLEIFVGPEGQIVNGDLTLGLGLDALAELPRPPRLAEGELQSLLDAGTRQANERCKAAEAQSAAELLPRRRQEEQQLSDYFSKTRRDVAAKIDDELTPEERAALEEQLTSLDAQLQRRLASVEERYAVQGQLELAAAVLAWCKRTEGKLRFTIGEQLADLPFAGWARSLVPPPFVCPATGTASMHVAATDDGRITVAEEIDRCAESGRRTLRRELVRCSVTGKLLLPEFSTRCSVTGEAVAQKSLLVCGECREAVSPRAIEQGRCAACRNRKEVSKDDPRMARVLGEHPPLDRWRGWKLAETATVYNLAAAGLFKRLLAIVDKESLSLRHVATGTRLSSTWTAVEPSQYRQEM